MSDAPQPIEQSSEWWELAAHQAEIADVHLRVNFAKKLTGRRTVVLLISDGLDTGTAETLDSELVWLKRHTRSLLWLNPLLRFEGYAPIATGASVLNQHVNGMLAIHNLSRLEELASALNKLLKIK